MIQALVGWGPAAIWAAVLFLLSELPPDAGGGGFPVNDKLVHFGLYAVLGGALAWAEHRLRGVPLLLLLLLGAGYGAFDEWHQGMVPGRDPSVADFLADCAGVTIGFFFLRRSLLSRAVAPTEREP